MNPSRSTNPSGDTFGNDLETGILGRAREWTDVFPWLRYLRVLRLVASPTSLFVVAVTLAIWWQLIHLTLERPERSRMITPSANLVEQEIMMDGDWLQRSPRALLEHLNHVSPVVLWEHVDWWERSEFDSPMKLAFVVLVSTVIWTPAVLHLLRQGATLTAGRPMLPFTHAMGFVFRRSFPGWIVGMIPAVVVGVGIVFLYVVSLIGQVVGGIGFLETILALMLALSALLIGLVGFGSQFAVPLAWSAIVNESNGDILDSLSRGYEYFLRRPIHLIFNLFIVIVIVGILTMLAGSLSEFSVTSSSIAFRHAGVSETLQSRFAVFIWFLPIVVMITLFWGLMGGLYLLLRQSAGGQEVEDLWIPERSAPDPLPVRT